MLKITGKADDSATRYQAASHRMYFEEGYSKGAQIVGVKMQSLWASAVVLVAEELSMRDTLAEYRCA